MNATSRKPGQNAASRQGRKKMRVLGILAAITLLTWSRQLFGGESDDASSAGGAKPAASAKEKAGTTLAKGPKSAKAILNFEQAMERMTQWPEALNRRVIDGPIEDLSPINWQLDPLDTIAPDQEPIAGQAATEDPAAAESPLMIPSAGAHDYGDGSELGIVLRSTVIFGAKRFAVLNGVRYAEGEIVTAGGTGRYLLVSVRSREVTLSSGDRTWTLVIRDQSTPDNKPDQAE